MAADEFVIDYQRLLVTMSLLKNVEDSDYTEKHSLRVGRYVKQITKELNYDIKQSNIVTRAAYFHDVGKIKLSKNVLFKVGRLTDEEFDEMKEHSKFSHDILISLGLPEEAVMALNHHEKLNGKGYPNGLKGDEINMDCRILSVADVFDALTSDRPYRKGLDIMEAVLFLYSLAGIEFDINVVKALHNVLIENKKIENNLAY